MNRQADNCNSRWPILIISLPDANERRSLLLPELDRAFLTYTLIDAVDGRNGLDADQEAMCDRHLMQDKFGRELADTEIACALSHRRAYEYVLTNDLPGALILEDDTVWTDDATSVLKALSPGDIDFLQLDYGWAEFWRFSFSKRLGNTSLRIRRFAKNAGLANSYIISQHAAHFILQNSTPLYLPADWPCDLRPLKPAGVVPRVCKQSQLGRDISFIESGRVLEKEKQKNTNDVSSSKWKRMLSFGSSCSARNPRPELPYLLYRIMTFVSRPR